MFNELATTLKELRDRLPIRFDEESFVFSSKVLPKLDRRLEVSQVVVKKLFRDYDSYYRVDCLVFYGSKDVYKYLGFAILSLLFHGIKDVSIFLENKRSDVHNLILEYDHESNPRNVSNYMTTPLSFEYFPKPVEKHPWVNQNLNPRDLPLFLLTNEKQSVIKAEEWLERDTVVITGTDEALVRLAELFLNISNPGQKNTEYVLESELGFRGVGPGSVEVVFELPGSIGWDESLFK